MAEMTDEAILNSYIAYSKQRGHPEIAAAIERLRTRLATVEAERDELRREVEELKQQRTDRFIADQKTGRPLMYDPMND